MVRKLLGQPDEIVSGFWRYPGRQKPLPESHSILGWYYNQRGKIVETNVTGGLVSGKSSDIVQQIFGNLVYPGDAIDTFPKRLPRATLVDIVEKVRNGILSVNTPANVRELEKVAQSWSWDSHGQKFRQYQESWENYLMPGNMYKAASISSIIRRLFPGRADLSFL